MHSFPVAPTTERADPAGGQHGLSAVCATVVRYPSVLFSLAFVLALLPRLIGLESFLTADEGFWMQRTIRFGAAIDRADWGGTFRSGHPGVTTMWIGLIGIGPQRLGPLISDRYS